MPLSIPYMAPKALCFSVDRSSVYVHNREQEILQLAGHWLLVVKYFNGFNYVFIVFGVLVIEKYSNAVVTFCWLVKL